MYQQFADDADNASARTDQETEAAIAATLAAATPLEPGIVGDCHLCGVYRPRLVGRIHRGQAVEVCTFCRDKHQLDRIKHQ